MNNSKYNILLNDWSLWMSGLSPLYNWNVNGNMAVDGYRGLTLEYNALGKVSRVKSGTSTKVSYTYLADGTKVSALDASGNGLLYSGSMVFRKEGNESNPESMAYSGGRFVADASGVLRPQILTVTTRMERDGMTGALNRRTTATATTGRSPSLTSAFRILTTEPVCTTLPPVAG